MCEIYDAWQEAYRVTPEVKQQIIIIYQILGYEQSKEMQKM